MKGFVPTPAKMVDSMVEQLFDQQPPRRGSRLIDPGCGHGAFIDGVLRWCRAHAQPCPEIVGIDSDPEKLDGARRRLAGESSVRLVEGDFLASELGSFDYVIGNPPYVGIEALTEAEKTLYRRRFRTARARLDLYLLFWERAIEVLLPQGRVVFITPEKYTYVETARPLRRLLAEQHVAELRYAPHDTFPGCVTYPLITTVEARRCPLPTRVRRRDGSSCELHLPLTGESWQPILNEAAAIEGGTTLSDLALRVSCGVATGADSLFVFDRADLPPNYRRFARPAIAGRDLRPALALPNPHRMLLIPYDDRGALLGLDQLEGVAAYLCRPEVRARLEARTCARRKPWYAFHETPPLREMSMPKIICKDIARNPQFWIDEDGSTIPLHSTYYIVPKAAEMLHPLAAYLNSPEVGRWLRAHCHRAANDFIRVQSTVLKRLPVPDRVLRDVPQTLRAA